MPTREERLAKSAAASRDKIAEEKRKLASTQSAQREDARKSRDKRRYQVGTWCDDAGLASCDDALLQALVALCRSITDRADPGVTLAACQALVGGLPGTSLDGCAQAAPDVSATHSVGTGE